MNGQQTVAVSGSTGMVGTALIAEIEKDHRIKRIVRNTPKGEDEIRWDTRSGTVDAQVFADVDVVVHLAGENIAEGRWNEEKKRRIRDSRVEGTKLLCQALTSIDNPPHTLVCASAIGYYADRGDEVLDEESPPGEGFLAEVCKEWEAATVPAAEKGIRVVNLRIGVVLSDAGGALPKMVTPFKLGGGGKIGSGRQYMSWIVLEDLVSAIQHVMKTDSLSGPVNATAPNPVTNSEFTKALGHVLSRPTIVPMPAFAAKLAFGEMAEELLLASTRVEPKRLLGSGFEFKYSKLEPALRHLLKKE